MGWDAEMRLLYLSILGIALLVGLFSLYRGRLGTALQNAAIWGLIFLGAVLAYGFRDQLAYNLVPGTAVASGEEIRIQRRADGHFHAVLEVNGTDLEFLVDTGATEIVLAPQDARRIGLDPEALAFTQRAQTANGIVRAAPVRIERIRFAGIEDRRVPALVNGAPLHASLLGMGYLERFSSIEIAGDTLILRR